MSSTERSVYEMIADSLSYQFVSGGYKIPHKDHLTHWRNLPFSVVVYVHSGQYFCELKNSERFTIPPGKVLVVPEGVIHRVSMTGQGVLSVLHISYHILHSVDILSLFHVPLILPARESKAVSDSLREIYSLMPQSNIDIHATLKLKLSMFENLRIILNASEPKSGVGHELLKIQNISTVIEYIGNHLSDDLTRKKLADLCSLSETRFHYVFKEATGVSPMQYVNEKRLSQARTLLLSTSMSISEIAAQVGYNDYYHFCKLFKSKTGLSPSKYRKLYQETLVILNKQN